QFIVAVISVILTLSTAMALGFRIEGSFATMLLIIFLLIISVIGIGLIIVSFSKTSTFVLSMGTFPLFILMFFTGSIFPMPRNEIFEIGGHLFAWNDMLPPTYAVIALNKVMSLGGSFTVVQFELIMLTILSILYFSVGVWLFKKLHFGKA
ncbi:MAG: hypothetical protein HGB12_03150, partial [Bacteroidetes bacterium]|nr:hypothetical protein [Bacteroidota bacterium]